MLFQVAAPSLSLHAYFQLQIRLFSLRTTQRRLQLKWKLQECQKLRECRIQMLVKEIEIHTMLAMENVIPIQDTIKIIATRIPMEYIMQIKSALNVDLVSIRARALPILLLHHRGLLQCSSQKRLLPQSQIIQHFAVIHNGLFQKRERTQGAIMPMVAQSDPNRPVMASMVFQKASPAKSHVPTGPLEAKPTSAQKERPNGISVGC